MNEGVHTPDQAARSLRVVRLVSLGMSGGLFAVTLLAIASLRYAPIWGEPPAPRIAVVSEVVRTPPPVASAPPRRPPDRVIEPSPQAEAEPLPAAPPSEPVVITAPVWTERPRNPERFYPRDAFMQGIAGEVVLDCEVSTEGRLACVVASELPADRGFGDAALRLAAAHVMRPATQNGAPVRGRYRMVVPFSPGG